MPIADILREEKLIKPKRFEVFQEENMTFNSGLKDDVNKSEEEELKYRKRYEEALVRIEDQEDVEASKNAQKEMDDEFDQEDLSPRENRGN